MDKLTGLQRDLLIIIAQEPQDGLDIKKEVEEYYEKEIPHGRLYPNLDTLVEKHYVTKAESDSAPRTNRYMITDEGKETIQNHLEWRSELGE